MMFKRALLVVAFCLHAAACSAAIIHVPADYLTIQAAIDAAAPGDTVQVAAGTFNESVAISTSGITLQGAGAGLTTVAAHTAHAIRVHGGAQNVTIRAMTVTARDGSGVVVEEATQATVADAELTQCAEEGAVCSGAGASVVVASSTITGNGFGRDDWEVGAGVTALGEGADAEVTNNVIRANRRGVRAWNGASATVTGNEVSENPWSGVDLGGPAHATISGNTITGNGFGDEVGQSGCGVHVWAGAHADVSDNLIEGNPMGFDIYHYGSVTATGNHIADSVWWGILANKGSELTATANTIERNGWVGIFVTDRSSAEVVGNTITENGAGGEPWRAAGVYVTWDAFAEVRGNAMGGNRRGIQAGHGSTVTAIDNEISDSVWEGVVVYDRAHVAATGNTIEGSGGPGIALWHAGTAATATDNEITDSGQYGVLVTDGTALTLVDSTISNSGYDGIRCQGDGTTALIQGNTLTANGWAAGWASGILVWSGAEANVVGNTIVASRKLGVSISSPGTVAAVTANEIRDSGSSGVRVEDGAHAIVADNDIQGNGGNGAYARDDAHLEMTGNSVSASGAYGMYARTGATAVVAHNTLVDNAWDGVGIQTGSSAELRGNTIADNGRDGMSLVSASSVVVSENHIHDNASDGIKCSGTSPTIEHNVIADNGDYGIKNQVRFGANADPATADDDVLAEPTIIGNSITGNAAGGIHSLDTAPANADTLANDNTFNDPLQPFWVKQDWYGLVQVQSMGLPLEGAEVNIHHNDLDPAADYGPYSTDINGYAPDTSDYHNAYTWPIITQYIVDSDGVLHDYAPHTVTASHGGSRRRSSSAVYRRVSCGRPITTWSASISV